MKRFSKVIALALLLAVVVSAFGIFSAFAEPVVDTGITTIYDSNSETPWSSTVSSNNGTYPVLTKPDSTTIQYDESYKATVPYSTDASGNRYYKFGYNVAFPEADLAAGGTVTIPTNPMFAATGTGSQIYVADAADGSYQKNTDFVVLDFDVDANHLYQGDFWPQLRFWNHTTAKNGSQQSEHLRVYPGDVTGEYQIDVGDKKYTIKSATDSDWLNLTVIMDTRDVAKGSTAYLYVNGLYVCSYEPMKKDATRLRDIRMNLETTNKEFYSNNANGNYIGFANFTVKAFKNGYSGALAENFDKVGNSFYTLDNFSELAYWDDNQIVSSVATVEHKDGSTDTLKSLDDFGAVVKAGDKVTLNGHIFNSLYIPGKTEIVDDKEVVTPLVTFDANGYYMAAPIPVDTEKYDWVINVNGVNTYGSQDGLLFEEDYNKDGYKDGDFNFDGEINSYYVKAEDADKFMYRTHDEFAALELTTSAEEDTDGGYTTKITEADRYTVIDPLFTAIPSDASATITLLNDITMYGPGTSGTESSLTATKALQSNHYFNLNGKTLTVDAKASHLFSCTGEYNNNVVFRNGTLIFTSPATNNLIYWDNHSNTDEATYYGTATFDNLTKLEVNKVLIDQRIGVIRFINCDDIVTNGTLVSEKSGRIKFAKVLLYDSTITANASPFVIANISGGGTYQGSHNNELNITKSTITADGCTPIQLLTRNESGTSELGLLNNNKTTVLISGSTITADGGSFFYDSPSFTTKNVNLSETVFTTNANVDVVNGSTISVTDYLFNRDFEKTAAKNTYKNAIENYAGVDYNFNLFVDSSSKVASGLTFFDCYYKNEEFDVDFTLKAEAGALLGYPELTNDSDEVVITLPEGNKLAFTNTNEGYNRIVTSNYTTNTYTKGTAVVDEEFYWNIAENEEVIMEWVTDLAETAAYKYTWATSALENGTAYTATLAPNFTPSVSMSTDGTLALNLFLPTEVYEALGGENVNFASPLGCEIDKALDVSLGQYDKEGTFVQAKVKGIDPLKANETAVTVTFNIIGAYGDSIEKPLDISVVSYAKMVIKNGTAAEKQYAVQLLNYVKAVIAYKGEDITAITAIDNIIKESGLTVNVGNVGEAAAGGAVTGIGEFAMNLGGSINWVLTVSGNDTYTVSYTRDGETVTVERTAENGEIVISLRAYDALGTVTVTNNSDDTSSTFNIANYYAAQNENAQAVLTALAAYASEAAAYKAQLDANLAN